MAECSLRDCRRRKQCEGLRTKSCRTRVAGAGAFHWFSEQRKRLLRFDGHLCLSVTGGRSPGGSDRGHACGSTYCCNECGIGTGAHPRRGQWVDREPFRSTEFSPGDRVAARGFEARASDGCEGSCERSTTVRSCCSSTDDRPGVYPCVLVSAIHEH